MNQKKAPPKPPSTAGILPTVESFVKKLAAGKMDEALAMLGKDVPRSKRLALTDKLRGMDFSKAKITSISLDGKARASAVLDPVTLKATGEECSLLLLLVRADGAPNGWTIHGAGLSKKHEPTTKPKAKKPSQPAARVAVSIGGHTSGKVGSVTQFVISVRNVGRVPLTKVKIECSPNKILRPIQATEGFRRDGKRLVWTIDSLAAGVTKSFTLNCKVLSADELARCRVVVTTAEGARAEGEAHFEIPEPAKKLVPVDGGAAEEASASPTSGRMGLE